MKSASASDQVQNRLLSSAMIKDNSDDCKPSRGSIYIYQKGRDGNGTGQSGLIE